MSERFDIPWGAPALGRTLEDHEIASLKDKLTELAKGTNVISTELMPAECRWIEDNVKNCHTMRVTDDTGDGSVWILIGPDKETVMAEWNRI